MRNTRESALSRVMGLRVGGRKTKTGTSTPSGRYSRKVVSRRCSRFLSFEDRILIVIPSLSCWEILAIQSSVFVSKSGSQGSNEHALTGFSTLPLWMITFTTTGTGVWKLASYITAYFLLSQSHLMYWSSNITMRRGVLSAENRQSGNSTFFLFGTKAVDARKSLPRSRPRACARPSAHHRFGQLCILVRCGSWRISGVSFLSQSPDCSKHKF